MKFLSSLKNKNLSDKTCLLRVDLDIEDNRDINNPRLLNALPTIKFLIKRKAKIVILSHRGRPKGGSRFKKENTKRFSLKPFAKAFSLKLRRTVHFVDLAVNGEHILRESNLWKVSQSPAGSIFMLENLRFCLCEIENDKKFARELASLGTFYVNDAFAVSHHANASNAAIANFLPSYAGLHLENEIKNLSAAKDNFKKPLVIILGGAKVSDKIGLLQSFYPKADYFLLGGAIVNTMFFNIDLPIGDSIYENIKIDPQIMAGLEKKVFLPIDTVIFNNKILDIGPETIKKYKSIIAKARTIIWNGPMGLIEDKRFRRGSEEIAKAILKSKALSVIGGGETTALFERARNYAENNAELRRSVRVSPRLFISTGGGAMMEFLAGKKLPGIEALDDANMRI